VNPASIVRRAVLYAVLALPTLAYSPSSSHADAGVHISGNVNVKLRVGVKHRPRVRVRVQPRLAPVLRVYVGGSRFAQPPPPPPPRDCDCDDEYCSIEADDCSAEYDDDCDGGYRSPAPVVVPATEYRTERRADLPRFGIGVFAGSIEVADQSERQDLGLIGRIRLTESLSLEGEIAKTEMDELRLDRRLGGALVYDLMPRSRWSVELLAGTGVTQSEIGNNEWQTDQKYGEVGAGLGFRLTSQLRLGLDFRVGQRTPIREAAPDSFKAVAPSAEDNEEFSRGRLSAILSF